MSSYKTKALDMQTGEFVEVQCLDNYFGQHNYGYKIGDDDKVLAEDELDERYKLIGSI